MVNGQKKNNKKLPYGLYVVNAVQEEIGLRGAEMIARRIKPDIAIVRGPAKPSAVSGAELRLLYHFGCPQGCGHARN